MREQAHLIQKEVGALVDDIVRLEKRVGNLESHFNLAVKDIREIQTSSNKIAKRGKNLIEMELEESQAEKEPESLAPPAPSLDYTTNS